MFIRTNCDRKSQFSGILTEPLNPCAPCKDGNARFTKVPLKPSSQHFKEKKTLIFN